MKHALIGFALGCLIAAAGYAFAATLTLPLPQGCTMVAVSCPDTAPPNPPVIPPPTQPPVGSCAGYNVRSVDIPYPMTGNVRVLTSSLGSFGNYDAVVVHFRTPAADTTGGGDFTIVNAGGAPYIFRLATLDTKPCSLGTAPSKTIPAAIVGLAPVLNVNVAPNGGGFSGQTQLLPNKDYYLTIVNRNDYYGRVGSTPSCTAATCDAHIDSN